MFTKTQQKPLAIGKRPYSPIMKIIHVLCRLFAPLLFLPLNAADAAENPVRDYPADKMARTILR
ncbi:hypothetical protein [Sulfuriferula plumbiphila]|uniref:hypothetical protein n=1 Tax=Sulfuriferula plumbiphila TaxID=171865 RepID=UPI0013868F8B|nr:hypothetical protein [Sulfuriferula plumbiphila]